MKKLVSIFIVAAIFIFIILFYKNDEDKNIKLFRTQNKSYWFLLHRKSNVEFLYYGVPGDALQSALLKTFQVKTGQPGKKPTPLPQLFNRDYWILIDKKESKENPETAPYFLTLDIPYDTEVYGPMPYLECDGQCNWEMYGEFGLHGVNGDNIRLSKENGGSSGCIRHSDQDITYLYNLLNPDKEHIRYYIKDI